MPAPVKRLIQYSFTHLLGHTVIHSSYQGWLFSQKWSQPLSSQRGCSGWMTRGYLCLCSSAMSTPSLLSSSPGSEAPKRQFCCPHSPWLFTSQLKKIHTGSDLNHRKLWCVSTDPVLYTTCTAKQSKWLKNDEIITQCACCALWVNNQTSATQESSKYTYLCTLFSHMRDMTQTHTYSTAHSCGRSWGPSYS